MDTEKKKPTLAVMEMAMKLLGVRPHSEYELFNKLKKRGYLLSEINAALVDCTRYGFINDEVFARDYATLLSSRGYGKYVITQKLRTLRINGDFINLALSTLENSDEEAEKAFNFKMRMLKNENDIRKKREKIYRFMMTRGFSSDLIRDLWEKSQEK